MTGTPPTPTPPTNATAPTNVTAPPNVTAPNSTGVDVGGGGRGGGGPSVPDFPSPEELATGILLWAVDVVVGLATAMLEALQGYIFGIHAPGTPGDIASWGPPETGLWVGAWAVYWTVAPLAMALLVFQSMTAQGAPSGRDTTAKLAEIAKCGGMILAGWPIAIGGLHLASSVALAITPDAATLLSTPGNIGKVGLTAVVAGVLAFFQAGTVVFALAVIILEQVIVVAAVAFWPAWWALRPSDNGFANVASGIGLSMYLGVIAAKLAQAGLALLVIKASWGAGGGSAVLSLIGSAVGVAVTFVGIPAAVGGYFVPEAAMLLGTPAVNIADDYAGAARGRAKEHAGGAAREYADSARSRARNAAPSAGSIPTPTWSRGGGGGSAGGYDAAREVPEGYTPTPEPGSAQPSGGGGASAESGTSDGGQETVDRIRMHTDLVKTVSERQVKHHDTKRSV